jgi:hypothetical protein
MQESGGQDYSCILVEQGTISHNIHHLVFFYFPLEQLCFLAGFRIRLKNQIFEDQIFFIIKKLQFGVDQ